MEFHRHHHDDDEDNRRPDSDYSYGYDAPPPRVQHVAHGYGAPPPVHHESHGYGAPPPVHHLSHGYGAPPPVHHLSHGYDAPPPNDYDAPRRNDYDAPPRNDYDAPPRNEYGAPPRNEYDAPPRNEYGAPPAYGGGGYGQEQPHHQRPAHESYGGGGGYERSERPHGAPVEHVGHEGYGGGGGGSRVQTVRVFTKAKEDFSLSIRNGKIVLVLADPRDEHQHWIKDMRYSTKVKDQEGLPSFALVNKVTGEAIKHAIGQSHPVRLVPYKGDYLDESVLWTESNDTGEGFRCIRMVNNIGLNFDALHGDDDHGGVRDGTTVVLWEWTKGKNQRWKVVPY